MEKTNLKVRILIKVRAKLRLALDKGVGLVVIRVPIIETGFMSTMVTTEEAEKYHRGQCRKYKPRKVD